MEFERICLVDNTKYEYCGNCDRFNKEETWRYMFCSENCKGIYEIYDKYRQHKISADDAIEIFKNYKIPSINELHKIIKPTIADIYAAAIKDESGY